MPKFPLPAHLSSLHDGATGYATFVQNDIAGRGGCQSLSSEALNALMFCAVLTHRSVRTICEEGWTPIASVLNRTLLDIFANCIAVVNKPEDADFMGFKYMTHFQRKWLKEPNLSGAELTNVTANVEEIVSKLNATEQVKARILLAQEDVTPYWFQPEYGSPKRVLSLSTHPVYELYKLLSAPAHGGYGMKILMNDDIASESVEPREHRKNVPKAIMSSTRLLMEVCYVRDHFENGGVCELIYRELVKCLNDIST